ncbi:17153_t:CDS:2 [Gigaspora rosea]|nr:17153_t:CDS:2 [Gigaspora rosea]
MYGITRLLPNGVRQPKWVISEIEDYKHASVVQHEKQLQDTNMADTKTGKINEDGESPIQKGDQSTKTMNIEQDKQEAAPEKTI